MPQEIQLPSSITTAVFDGRKVEVVTYSDPDAKPLEHRWDASRKIPPPPPSREKIKRVLAEEAQRSQFQARRVGAYCKATFDSLRPMGLASGDLPYFELEWAANAPADVRLNLDYSTRMAVPASISTARRERGERCAERMWLSPIGRPYETLGEVPLYPAHVRPGERPKPLNIRGENWRPPYESNGEDDIRLLAPGAPLEGMVPKDGMRYFACNAPKDHHVTVALEVMQGDPDLFMSAQIKRPNADRFTWRSNSSGDTDGITIEAGGAHPDPNTLPEGGVYYIGVFGEKQSNFKISVRYWKPQIYLPPSPRRKIGRGTQTIHKHLRRSASRLATLRSGSADPETSLSGAVAALPLSAHHGADEQGRGGVSDGSESEGDEGGANCNAQGKAGSGAASSEVPAVAQLDAHLRAGRPAAKLLRSYSELALRGAPRAATQVALSLSFETLPLRGLVPHEEEEEEGTDGGSLRDRGGRGGERGGDRGGGARTSGSSAVLKPATYAASLTSHKSSHEPPGRSPGGIAGMPRLASPLGQRSGQRATERSSGPAGRCAGGAQAGAGASPERARSPPEPPLDLKWQPPKGYRWTDLPKGSRLVQALHESVELRSDLEARLERQLRELEEKRALTYIARTHALNAIDPTTHVLEPNSVRKSTQWMLASYEKNKREAEAHAAAEAAKREAEEAALAAALAAKVSFKDHPTVKKIDTKFRAESTASLHKSHGTRLGPASLALRKSR